MKTDSVCHEGLQDFSRFLNQPSLGAQRVFEWPIAHPAQPTGFCPCDRPWLPRLRAYAKMWWLLTVLRGPFNGPKIALLRRRGACISQQAYISAEVWIDPVFPQLLTIEEKVLIGHGTKIALHEFGPDRFRAGRVFIRRGAVVGGFALIGLGVEIGENAVVAGGAVVGRDVPAGMLAVGNPARNFPQTNRRQTD